MDEASFYTGNKQACWIGILIIIFLAVIGYLALVSNKDNPPESGSYDGGGGYTIPDWEAPPSAQFTLQWDKDTNELHLDAGASSPGYKYRWHLPWLDLDTEDFDDPVYVTTVPQDRDTNILGGIIILYLVDSQGNAIASGWQPLR